MFGEWLTMTVLVPGWDSWAAFVRNHAPWSLLRGETAVGPAGAEASRRGRDPENPEVVTIEASAESSARSSAVC
jgi:hypothetical protein